MEAQKIIDKTLEEMKQEKESIDWEAIRKKNKHSMFRWI